MNSLIELEESSIPPAVAGAAETREPIGLAGGTPEMLRIFSLIRQVAPCSASVLITGESGTGKELVARAIHALSGRASGPFVAINCAAFPDGLVESELFGHEKGSFTGAIDRQIGCLELANGGTLLLDEIGELPVQTQAKLLRVLDDARVRRIGGPAEIQLDVRVLAATNRDPAEVVRTGHFRQDLYYRLNVFQIELPPLRDRRDDLPVLCDALIAALNLKHARRVKTVHPEVMECFRQHSWPGNVRELRNVLETAVILARGETLAAEHLPEKFTGLAESEGDSKSGAPPVRRGMVSFPVGTTIEQAEKSLIQLTLLHNNNNKSRAARMLGISAKTLHCKLKQYRAETRAVAAG
jgi:DNA-binding NtrC family response regulator